MFTMAGALAAVHSPMMSAVAAVPDFPFKLVETTLDTAVDARARLDAPGVSAVILGPIDSVERLSQQIAFAQEATPKVTPEEVVAVSRTLDFPSAIIDLRRSKMAETCKRIEEMLAKNDAKLPTVSQTDADGRRRQLDREEVRKLLLESCDPSERVDVGQWPSEPAKSANVQQALAALFYDDRNGFIGVFPTDDATTVPALLNYGGWNSCPPTAYIVAALRSWRQRYGAELVGASGDSMVVSVTRRPDNREEALALASEQYQFCNDIVDQGLGSVAELAAYLMASDAWYFWWD